ncbi:MAG: hypothetical protein WBA93_05645, partial [Microcoleaceae cyanobacterium]
SENSQTEPTVIEEEIEKKLNNQTTSESSENSQTEPTVIEDKVIPKAESDLSIESQRTTKEKIGDFMNRLRRRFKRKETVISTEEKPLNETTEIPTSEETVTIQKESETKELLEPNQSSTLPEIVKEAPLPKPIEEILPPETPSLTPNSEQIIELPGTSTIMPEVGNYPPETLPELEAVGEQKLESTEESFESETFDSNRTVIEEIESENVLDYAPNLTGQ